MANPDRGWPSITTVADSIVPTWSRRSSAWRAPKSSSSDIWLKASGAEVQFQPQWAGSAVSTSRLRTITPAPTRPATATASPTIAERVRNDRLPLPGSAA